MKLSALIAKSTCLWIVGLFVIANCLWGLIRPLQIVPHTSQPNIELSKAALRFKMEELKSGKNPDIMIIGSSLPMCAFFYTEGPPYFDLKKGAQIRQLQLNLLQSYPKAGYFTHKMKELTGKDLNIFNFAGAACMVSDTRLVMSRTLEAGKKPKLIVYGVGLRDFVDNINPPPGETPYYKALCNLPFVVANLPELSHFPAFRELSLGALFSLYDLRNEFRISVEHELCKSLHHPTSIELSFILSDLHKQLKANPSEAEKKVDALKPDTAQKPNLEDVGNKATLKSKTQPSPTGKAAAQNAGSQTAKEDASTSTLGELDYRRRYTPANYKSFEAEMQELRNLVARCKKEGIKLVIINMPVSKGHLRLSPPGLRERYLKDLRVIAANADLFLDYEGRSFPDNDYFDTVHLNSTGAIKFADELSEKLSKSGLI